MKGKGKQLTDSATLIALSLEADQGHLEKGTFLSIPSLPCNILDHSLTDIVTLWSTIDSISLLCSGMCPTNGIARAWWAGGWLEIPDLYQKFKKIHHIKKMTRGYGGFLYD